MPHVRACNNNIENTYAVHTHTLPVQLGSLDYFAGESSEDLVAGSSQACVEFGSVDDNLEPILEDVEFYQISLTTDDNAGILPELSVADIFIIDNDRVLYHSML